MSDKEHMTQEQIMNQLGYIKSRLETFPIHEIQSTCLRDCMLLLIRTFAGEPIPEAQLTSIAGGVMEGTVEAGHSESINGELRRGGEEIAPGVIQYQPTHVATMDVEANQKLLQESLIPSQAPPPDMPKPVAGSIMAMAMKSEGKEVETVERNTLADEYPDGTPKGIPSPGETTVEITSPGPS